MRILHVTTYLHPERCGGAERIVRSLAVAQAARGHEVAVVTTSARGPFTPVREDGVDVLRHPLPQDARGARFLALVRRGTLDALAAIDAARFDVLHAHQVASAAPALARSGRRGRGPRTVFSCYAPYAAERAVEKGRRRTPLELLARLAARRLDHACLHRADRVHVLSDAAAAEVEAIAPRVFERLRVAAPGVDERFRPAARRDARPEGDPASPRGPTRLLTVRRLVRRMGLDHLIDAVAHVRTRGHDVTLDVAGEGPEAGALAERVRRARLRPHVRLVGRVEEEDLADRYRAADLFVLPTRALEGYGMATLEALSCGVPVVATNVGATPALLARWLPQTPCVAPSSGAIAAGIEEALDRLDELTRLARAAAPAVAAAFDPRAAADRMLALYDEAT